MILRPFASGSGAATVHPTRSTPSGSAEEAAKTREGPQWGLRSACDRYVAILEGESPLRALVRRTVREGKGVHREVESEESCIQNADLTNRKCI